MTTPTSTAIRCDQIIALIDECLPRTPVADPASWAPSAAELESILASMRPIIDRFADRDSRRIAQQMAA